MAVDRASDNPFPSILMVEGDPEDLASNPASGQRRLAVGTDHILYLVDDSGVKHAVGAVPTADDVAVTPFGSIAATNVQDALEEIIAEATGFTDPMTTRGDIIVRDSSNVTARLAKGAYRKVLMSDGTDVSYAGPVGLPPIVQASSNAASTTSLGVTIAAAASGSRLIVCIGSNARDVNAPTCTNVTFTDMGGANFSTTMYVSIYVGVVSGGSSGTTVTITATGSNFIEADVYEVLDPLTPTAGTSANLTNTSAAAVTYTNVAISPTAGTFWAAVFGEDNGTTSLRLDGNCLFRSYKTGAGTAMSAIGYAPGGPFGLWITQGTSGGDFAGYIVPIT